ncbi:uncharacterized protein LTR77_006503 [Saxophila tyrrhenica]|uniref:Uncharacterized protein n=1 Tax=Saxophila tyrrhenica TaxID=1690608 RepID=A0AAV9PBI7_9PEZI|nr:hypothetical protein LTR77_006503 [Saxophila tyrrhenica]
MVQLSEVETAFYGDRSDPRKVYGRRKNRAFRGVVEKEFKSVDMLDEGATAERPSKGLAVDSLLDDGSEGSDGSIPGQERFETSGVSLRIRPPQVKSDVNFSVGGERGWAEKIEETPEMQQKRVEGTRRAEEKEAVKQMARRAVVFGLPASHSGGSAREEGRSAKRKSKRRERHEVGSEGEEPRVRKCEALMGANNTNCRS